MVPPFIAFLGPDGTGKSTHARILVDHFKSHNYRVRQVWIRSPHTLAFLLSYFFVKIGLYRITANPFGKQRKIPAVHTSGSLRFFWPVVEVVSVLPLILFRVYIPRFLGYTIIAERYVADTVVNIAYFTDNLDFVRSRTAKLLLRFIPKNPVLIHLDADYSTITERRSRLVEPYDFIEFQRAGYKMIADSVGAKRIDTSNASVKETSMRIMQWLKTNNIFQSQT